MTLILKAISSITSKKIQSSAVLAATIGLLLTGAGNAETELAPSCPDGYWRLDTVYSNDKGAAFPAKGTTSEAIAVKHGGKAQDWKLGALCMRTSDGDVWIFDVPSSGSKVGSR